MIYSSAALSVHHAVKALLADCTSSVLASRKVETSDPSEVNEEFLVSELRLHGERVPEAGTAAVSSGGSAKLGSDEPKPFARPKGPGRRGAK